MKKKILLMLTCVLAGNIVGCSFTDEIKAGMKDSKKQESVDNVQENDAETVENTESKETPDK